jgi:hypothetical protein
VARATAGLVVASMTLGGCVIDDLIAQRNVLGLFTVIFGGVGGAKSATARAKALPKLKESVEVLLTGQIGGLTGTYNLTLGKYGTFTGTATIGRDRKSATVKAADTPELRAVADAFVLDLHQVDIDVTSVSAKVTGRQTTGGVKKSWNGKIKFKGTVAAGPDTGRAVKGTISSKGSF